MTLYSDMSIWQSYIQELGLGFKQSKRHFLADADVHHTSALGHALVAQLLIDLVVDDQRLPPPPVLMREETRNMTAKKTPFQSNSL
jgi:hypothetical protein